MQETEAPVTHAAKEADDHHKQSGLPERFRKLDNAITVCDPVDSGLWLEAIRCHPASANLKAELDDLEHRISVYDFEGARENINRIISEL